MSVYISPRELMLAALAVALLYLPFVDKAIHVDDPVVLQVAENILEDPLDPFGGEIDWFGTLQPLWQVTTNPPLLSYYLAPFAAAGISEVVLHLAMLPFVWILMLSLLVLSRRLSGSGWWPALFAVSSPALIASLNLMRDVPAVALSTAGIALFLRGTEGFQKHQTGNTKSDAGAGLLLVVGSLLAGLAILIKYSAVVALPALVAYPLLMGSRRPALLAPLSLLPLGLWCLFTYWRYGWAHPFYLLSSKVPGEAMGLNDFFFPLVLIIGSSLLLAPLLALRSDRRGEPGALTVVVAAPLAAFIANFSWAGWDLDLQYMLWFAFGFIMLAMPLIGERSAWGAPKSPLAGWVFLYIWLGSALASALFLVPFPAVRHLIPAIPPLVLLLWKILADRSVAGPVSFRWAAALLALQVGMALMVARSDALYADSYRDFARLAEQRWGSDRGEIWFVGHWGWKFYAEQSGFRQMHGDGESPAPGDLLIWPRRIHVGQVFEGKLDLVEGLELLEEKTYDSALPVRTMNFEGAAYYATVRNNLPYRFQRQPFEVMRVYRVRE